jgi:hypothetical protein
MEEFLKNLFLLALTASFAGEEPFTEIVIALAVWTSESPGIRQEEG